MATETPDPPWPPETPVPPWPPETPDPPWPPETPDPPWPPETPVLPWPPETPDPPWPPETPVLPWPPETPVPPWPPETPDPPWLPELPGSALVSALFQPCSRAPGLQGAPPPDGTITAQGVPSGRGAISNTCWFLFSSVLALFGISCSHFVNPCSFRSPVLINHLVCSFVSVPL